MTDRSLRRRNNVIWAARKIGTYPNGHVRCEDHLHLAVMIEPGDGNAYGLRMDRKLARLIAKRINQCLDQTK